MEISNMSLIVGQKGKEKIGKVKRWETIISSKKERQYLLTTLIRTLMTPKMNGKENTLFFLRWSFTLLAQAGV